MQSKLTCNEKHSRHLIQAIFPGKITPNYMNLNITDSKETFDYWLNKRYIDEELRKNLRSASILIVPFENLGSCRQPLFPIGTDLILQYLQRSLSGSEAKCSVDICISDNDFQTFEFNSRYRNIGKFIILSVAIPAFTNILSSYVYDNFITSDESKPHIEIIDESDNITSDSLKDLADKHYIAPPDIKISVTVVRQDGSAKNISYDGPASDFDNVLNALKDYEESE